MAAARLCASGRPVSAFDLAGLGGQAGGFGPAPAAVPLKPAVPAEASDGRIKVILVDSDADCLRRFAKAVQAEPGLQLLETAAHSDAAIRCVARHEPDVMVVEPGLSGAFGMALIRHCASRSPHTQILVRTQVGDDERVLAAIEAGAGGYVYRDAAPEWIVASIQALHDGGALISPGVARRVLARFRIRAVGGAGMTAGLAAAGQSVFGARAPADGGAAVASPLTEDEIGILRLVACGTGLAEIAEVLARPPRAVLTHIKRVYRQLSAQARAEGRTERPV